MASLSFSRSWVFSWDLRNFTHIATGALAAFLNSPAFRVLDYSCNLLCIGTFPNIGFPEITEGDTVGS